MLRQVDWKMRVSMVWRLGPCGHLQNGLASASAKDKLEFANVCRAPWPCAGWCLPVRARARRVPRVRARDWKNARLRVCAPVGPWARVSACAACVA
jgi:hypothetical protein